MNYYIADIDNPLKYASTYPANSTSGIIVGLYPGTFYWSGVQVYNTAGLGPESETDLEQTYADGKRFSGLFMGIITSSLQSCDKLN